MDNVFYKGSGYSWLWNDLSKMMIKNGYWNVFKSEHPNSKSKVSKQLPEPVNNFTNNNHYSCKIRPKLEKDIYKYLEYSSRLNEIDQEFYSSLYLHDNIDIFNILIEHYCELFIKNNISLYITSRPPHIGQDYVCYRVAEELGIKTLILFNFPYIINGRFFHVFNNDDFGTFNTSVVAKENLNFVKIERTHKEEIDYLDTINKRNKSFEGQIKQNPLVHYIRNMITSKSIIEPTKRFRYELTSAYNYKKNIVNNINDIENFIYFPLHLQPEMSTSNWGGMYRDQALAIEHLSSILPNGWYVVVKENPRQKAFQRGNFFYKRLNALQNVILVGKKINTYKLIRESKLVATITGSAGWEAIKGGKPVIIFGKCVWYSELPGVFKFNPEMDINKLSEFKIDHKELESEFNRILGLSHKGVVAYKQHHDIDINKNIENVYNSLKKVLYNQ